MHKLTYAVEAGGLKPEHHERIFALADKGWKAPRIAREIRKHPSTVGWFMYRHGLRPPRSVEVGHEVTRNGQTVRGFSRDEDVLMQALRVQDLSCREIAAIVSRRFGHPRNHHTVACRLVMLAGQETAHG